MLLRSKMATPGTENDVKNISDKLDKISKSLVDNNTSLLQLTVEIKELRTVVPNRWVATPKWVAEEFLWGGVFVGGSFCGVANSRFKVLW